MMPAAMASPHANAGFGRADMRAGTNAAIADTPARADRTDMGARIDAVAADTCAYANIRFSGTGAANQRHLLDNLCK